MRRKLPLLFIGSLSLIIILFPTLITQSGCRHEPINSNKRGGLASATPITANANASASSGKIGVPECDAFLDQYRRCIEARVPERLREQYNENLMNLRDSWQKLADDPQTRSSLSQVCKSTAVQNREAMRSFNCDL